MPKELKHKKDTKKAPTLTPKEGGEAVQEGGQTGDLCLG
jgi:hypothetical protein